MTATLLAMVASVAAPLAAQTGSDGVPLAAPALVAPDTGLEALAQAQYPAVRQSIVCIRTVVRRDLQMVVPETGLMGTIKSPIALHGTGIVIDSVERDGRREYIVLTNDHVANPSLYFDVHTRFVRELKTSASVAPPDVEEQSYIVDSSDDDDTADDVSLRVIARNPTGDVALLETVGATRPFAVFRGHVGDPGHDVVPGALVITSGFPYGDDLHTAFGRLLDLHYAHALGIPHVDYSVDTPLEPGQSGSPVFLVTQVPGAPRPEVAFSLIGLLHARQQGTHLMVPYGLWAPTLAALPGHDSTGNRIPGAWGSRSGVGGE